ncbi:MAG: DUF4352 domain-containing protein [Candidatus Levybacteria bacterium]|nr:DUF4352 domain-containing protein [Candidatus Levybacteria bacterium]
MYNKAIIIVIGLAIFGVGFFAGGEYKAYRIRTAIQQAFSGNTNPFNSSSLLLTPSTKQAKKEIITIVQKAIGDEIALATLKLKVNSVEEKQTLIATYGSPKVAKEGTKFVVVNLDITNTTNRKFSFSPDIIVVDNKNREYSTYSESIGAIDNYLNYKDLSPSVKETGYLIYEIPNDATSYSLVVGKEGTNELYKIVLK